MPLRLVLFLLAFLPGLSGWAQPSSADTLPRPRIRFRDAFLKGQMRGSFRTFLMATDNAPGLSDPYALAAGGGLHFETAPWRGFGLGIGGAFNFNLLSSDLSRRDPATNAANRYEIGLFDVENPQNRRDLDRLEEFWLRYAHKRTRITLGQQLLQTPFVNHQDGRMRPTAEKGIWAENTALPHTRIQVGWLWQMSPRSTVRWYSVSTSIGLYPQGLNPDGTRSGYQSQLSSQGIGLLGISRSWGQRLKVQAWDQYVQNIFNTAFIQADYEHALRKQGHLLLGLQFTRQDALHEGGNPDVDKTYFQPGGQSNTLSAQLGWKGGRWQALGAYPRVTADGRFLSPREWGRE
ncbi:MAG TPA: OprD family outer membrane porin, partial [Saprospiraceae bacterium]|nr:OprD family outer membrane porin [Saprospiraceae bacterium]